MTGQDGVTKTHESHEYDDYNDSVFIEDNKESFIWKHMHTHVKGYHKQGLVSW